ncbi:MAG: lipocalin family protein [Bacteroidales bacterium]|nr:lipocalin family protein [Bacteroidales bacterium]
MKKVLSILMVAFAMTAMVACDDKDNDTDNPGGGSCDGNGFSTEMFVGTWRVENMTVNGQNMTPGNMLFTMNEDGTGLANDNGVVENNEFTWSVDGDQLTITPRSGVHFVYTVNSLTENECTFSGTNVPMADIPGDVVVHLVRAE